MIIQIQNKLSKYFTCDINDMVAHKDTNHIMAL